MICTKCPYLSQCTASKDHVKLVTRHVWEEYMETCEDIRMTIGMKDLYSHRKETIERIFGTAKENHGFRYTQMYGKARMTMKVALAFACMNLKKLAKIKNEWRLKMAKYRKLGRTSSQRKALLRNQITNLLYHGKIVTTQAKAKEVQKQVEGLSALAIKEKDNFETVKVKAKVPRKDKDGKRVKEVVDGKKVTVYDEVEKEIKKDLPSRLHARRQILRVLYPVVENPGKKRDRKEVDLVAKMFDEIAPKYVNRHGGYTRIIKIGQRKGDAAMEVVLELV